MASKRRQHLSAEGVQRIVRAIESVDAMQVLSWKGVQQLASDHAGSGYVWTRQALERYASIKSAYLSHEATRRKLIRNGGRTGRRLSEPQKLARLEQENQELRARLDQYDELFATYLVNAVAHGVSVEQLSRPLERPTRGGGNSDNA
jgi:hypothetical protein